jgi:hypothetical protein
MTIATFIPALQSASKSTFNPDEELQLATENSWGYVLTSHHDVP